MVLMYHNIYYICYIFNFVERNLRKIPDFKYEHSKIIIIIHFKIIFYTSNL